MEPNGEGFSPEVEKKSEINRLFDEIELKIDDLETSKKIEEQREKTLNLLKEINPDVEKLPEDTKNELGMYQDLLQKAVDKQSADDKARMLNQIKIGVNNAKLYYDWGNIGGCLEALGDSANYAYQSYSDELQEKIENLGNAICELYPE